MNSQTESMCFQGLVIGVSAIAINQSIGGLCVSFLLSP